MRILKPLESRRVKRLIVLLTEEEFGQIRAVCEAEKRDMSEWVRARVVPAARAEMRKLEKGATHGANSNDQA